jgi:hypothetical protein
MVAILNARNSTAHPSRDHFPLDLFPSIASNEGKLSVMLTRQGPGALELTWKDVVLAKKLKWSNESIVLFFKDKTESRTVSYYHVDISLGRDFDKRATSISEGRNDARRSQGCCWELGVWCGHHEAATGKGDGGW